MLIQLYLGDDLMLYYCKKCGRILQNNWDDPNYKCDCCKSATFPIPEKYWLNGLNFLINDELENLLIEELVKPSPEFDQYLFDHKNEILAKQSAEFNAKMAHGKAILEGKDKNKFGVQCPYCHSTNVSKITNTSKAVHTALFGIFSISRNSKNYHCNSCKSDF